MKRYLTLLLALLMVVLPLMACADKTDDGKSEGKSTGGAGTTPVDTDPDADPSEVLEVPANLEYGGVFEILAPTITPFCYSLVDFDEPSEDAYENALYLRNQEVEDYLGIEIHQNEAGHGENLYQTFKVSTEAQSGDFDVVFNGMTHSSRAVGAGLCLPYDDIPYVNLNKAWWNDDCTEQLALGGNHYMISGDIALSDKEDLWLVFFTKDLIDNNGLENPYDLVDSNNWTWDKMHDMAATAAYDANANDVLDKSGADTWGLTAHQENWAAMWQSAGLKLITLDRNGYPEVTWGTEQFFDVYSDISDIMNDKSCVSPDDDAFSKATFASGKTLFTTEVVAHIRNWRNNEHDFGLVPFPKYKASDERYNTYVTLSACVVAVGNDNMDLERTGAVLETMGAFGRRILTPAYYEGQLKSRFARDERAGDMLDIIFEYRSYDLGIFFDWGEAYSKLRLGNQNPSQLFASISRNLNRQIEQSLTALDLY